MPGLLGHTHPAGELASHHDFFYCDDGEPASHHDHILIVIVMMLSLLVREINTNNTAISAIDINFIVIITKIVSTNQEGAGPTVSALPGGLRQMHILQSGLHST